MWYHFKEPIVDFLGVSRDALHVHMGLLIFLLVAMALRNSSHRVFYAWLAVLAAQTINEFFDFLDWYHWTKSWNWQKSATDTIHTMLWPSVVLVLARQPKPPVGRT